MKPTGTSSLRVRVTKLACGALLTGLLACVSLASPAFAQSAIRVLVNDEPITSLDIQARAKMMSVFSRGKEGEKQAIDQLIDERLMLQEAKRRNVVVSDDELNQELATRARAAKLTPDRFTQALRGAGVNPQTYKDFLRANLAWQRIVRARFRATVNITDQDVTAALTDHTPADGEQQTAQEYRLQAILFVIPSGAGAGVEAKLKGEANAFRSAFKGCDQALQQASGNPDIVVKPETRRESGQLPADLQASLDKLDVGGITEPQRVPEGIQLVALCAKNAIAGQTEATVATRQELSSERGQLLARRYLRDLRSDAVIDYR